MNIEDLYKNVSYLDEYGSSILFLILITFAVFVIISYCYVMIHLQPIQEDWSNQRCKPYILPFAGWIAPTSSGEESKTALERNATNFTYCTQNILSSITGMVLEPIQFVIQTLGNMTKELQDSVNAERAMIDKVRSFFQTMAEELMGRILNTTIPLQQMVISVKDMFAKIQGSMTAGLFTLLGSYYALKALMGAIAQFIITILIALAAMIAAFWIFPFTWGAAIANTAIFIAISIPMALILAFMIDILKAKPDLAIPRLKCFDEDTMIRLADGGYKRICEIQCGEKLFEGTVTAKIKVLIEGSIMYKLNGVIVSDSHVVFMDSTKKKCVSVSEHPMAKKIENYEKPYLYCLNTTNKCITVNGITFTDWDELYGATLESFMSLKREPCLKSLQQIHEFYDGGFEPSTEIEMIDGTKKPIGDICVGDILKEGKLVYGVVQIDIRDVDIYTYVVDKEQWIGTFHLRTENGELLKRNICYLNPLKYKNRYFMHLLTNTGNFYLKGKLFRDYNHCIDDVVPKID